MKSECLQETPCPVCGGESFKIVFPASYPKNLSRDHLAKLYRSSGDEKLMDQLVRCQGCQFLFLNPRPKDDIIAEAYSEAVDPTFFSQNPSRIKTFKRVFNSVISKLKISPSKDKKVLDVGCAGGAFPKAASDLGFDSIGIEPSQWLCETGKKEYGLDLRPGFLKEGMFPEKTFDFITLWDVFEHLTDPKEMLSMVKGYLKEDGYFVINYPDYASLARKIMGKKWPFFLSVHLSYFTPKTITKFLDQNGFETVFIKPHFQSLELGYVLSRATKIVSFFSVFEKIVKALRVEKIPFTYNVGQSLLVARKKT